MYTPTEHTAADKMITLYQKKKMIFQQYIPRKTKDLVSKFTSPLTPLAAFLPLLCIYANNGNMLQAK